MIMEMTNKLGNPFLKEGDVFFLGADLVVETQVPRHFLGHPGDFTAEKGIVKPEGELRYLQGRYIVIHAKMAGGSHGSFNSNNDYPDGHLVIAEREDGKYKVEFYQSGFSAPINEEKIPVVARAVQTWTIQD
jgi:hypothetical protein